MSKQIDALKLALEALKENQHLVADNERHAYVMEYNSIIEKCEEALAEPEQEPATKEQIREAMIFNLPLYTTPPQPKEPEQEPEFIQHVVEHPTDWSEWVCPAPQGYLMKCCDCGLVHEAEFGVVRYKSETEREDCEPVNDPNLQAVFRMRRSEQWSPEDTAHRAGGLPMAQPEQGWTPERIAGMKRLKDAQDKKLEQPEQEPVAWSYWQSCLNDDGTQTAPWVHRLSKFKPTESIINKDVTPLYTTPQPRKPLTREQILKCQEEASSQCNRSCCNFN